MLLDAKDYEVENECEGVSNDEFSAIYDDTRSLTEKIHDPTINNTTLFMVERSMAYQAQDLPRLKKAVRIFRPTHNWARSDLNLIVHRFVNYCTLSCPISEPILRFLMTNCNMCGITINRVLHVASANAHWKLACELLQKGADVTKSHALYWAFSHGNIKFINTLISYGINPEQITLYAINMTHSQIKDMTHNPSMVKFICSKNFNIPSYYAEAVRCMAKNNHLDVVELLMTHHLPNCVWESLSDIYVMNNNLEGLKLAIRNGLKPEHYQKQLLILATLRGHLEIVKYLVRHGADVHINNDTPISNSISCNHPHVTKYLLSVGANRDVYERYLETTRQLNKSSKSSTSKNIKGRDSHNSNGDNDDIFNLM